MQGSIAVSANPSVQYLLRIADSALILAQRSVSGSPAGSPVRRRRPASGGAHSRTDPALTWTRPDMEITIAGFATDAAIFREENVALQSELEELGAQYQKIAGGLSVEWEGETKTIPQLQPFLKSRDREVRERAFRLLTAPYVAERDAMAGLFDEMYRRRQEIAANAGFANFRDYIFPAKFRFDYTPADCERLHAAIEQTVVPAVGRALDRDGAAGRRELHGVRQQVQQHLLGPLAVGEDVAVAHPGAVEHQLDAVLVGQGLDEVDARLLRPVHDVVDVPLQRRETARHRDRAGRRCCRPRCLDVGRRTARVHVGG